MQQKVKSVHWVATDQHTHTKNQQHSVSHHKLHLWEKHPHHPCWAPRSQKWGESGKEWARVEAGVNSSHCRSSEVAAGEKLEHKAQPPNITAPDCRLPPNSITLSFCHLALSYLFLRYLGEDVYNRMSSLRRVVRSGFRWAPPSRPQWGASASRRFPPSPSTSSRYVCWCVSADGK